MLRLHLQLFADGAGEAAAGGEAAGGIDFEAEFQRQFGRSGIAAPRKTEAQSQAREPDAGNGQAESEAANTQTTEAQDPEKEFESLIKGKFKDQYGRRVQSTINERFKANNARITEAEKTIAAYKKAIAGYAQKLGVDVNDPEALERAVLDDKANFRAMAIEQGISVEEAARQFQAQQAQAEQAQAAQTAQQQMADQQREQEEYQRRQTIYDGWRKEEEEIRQADPEFDLASEIAQNAEFAKALDAGMSVRFAYNATHFDRRMAAVAGAVEKQTAISTAQRIAAQQHRPTEGGLGSGAAVKQTKVDYGSLSNDEFMELFKKTLQR